MSYIALQKEILLLNDEIHKKDILISDLQQCAGDNTKSVNQKLIKLKAQHKSQIRSLEQKIKDLQVGIIGYEEIYNYGIARNLIGNGLPIKICRE